LTKSTCAARLARFYSGVWRDEMRFAFFAASFALLGFSHDSAVAQERPIAIVHVRMMDGRGGAPVEDATIVLRGKVIEYAGPANGVKVPANAQVISGAGKTALPGLVDLHVHLQGAWE